MNIEKLILAKTKQAKEIKVADMIKATGFSRAYVNRFFKKLQEEGKIVLIGKANRAKYVLANKEDIMKKKTDIKNIRKIIKNINLTEDSILDEIKRDTGIFINLKENIEKIVDYGFTEILNNAIEHSMSDKIEIIIKKDKTNLRFDITDKGVGIFNNIIKNKKLKNELEAIQDLLKGKQTTAPKEHSGEGIFFTSKVADTLIIESSNKKLIFNNIINDIFIQNIKNRVGTRVVFTIALKNDKNLAVIFREYSEGSYEFSKTKVNIKLYKMNSLYISRSQARRILVGLDKFKTIILDFKNIKTIGQGFGDEIFRVWKNNNPNIKITTKNSNENIDFMIKRAKKL